MLLIFGLWAVAPEMAAQCYYTTTEIPGTQFAFPVAINNRGHVIGNFFAGEAWRGFFWSAETGVLMLPRPAGYEDVKVNGMNDLDQVVGYMNHPTQGWFGFVWDGKDYTLIPPPAWANTIEANAINNRGEVVGFALNVSQIGVRPFYWATGQYVDLQPTVGVTTAFAIDINEQSDVFGHGVVSGPPVINRVFVVRNGTAEWLPLPPPPYVASRISQANNNSVQVGTTHTGDLSDPDTRWRGIVWTGSSEYVILPSDDAMRVFCVGVNDAGRVIGRIQGSSFLRSYAWQFGRQYDLPPMIVPRPVNLLTHGHCVNRAGQILGADNGRLRVYSPIWQAGDVTGDCIVGLDDLMVLLSNFGWPESVHPQGDVNLDGIVDLADLAIVLGYWGH